MSEMGAELSGFCLLGEDMKDMGPHWTDCTLLVEVFVRCS